MPLKASALNADCPIWWNRVHLGNCTGDCTPTQCKRLTVIAYVTVRSTDKFCWEWRGCTMRIIWIIIAYLFLLLLGLLGAMNLPGMRTEPASLPRPSHPLPMRMTGFPHPSWVSLRWKMSDYSVTRIITMERLQQNKTSSARANQLRRLSMPIRISRIWHLGKLIVYHFTAFLHKVLHILVPTLILFRFYVETLIFLLRPSATALIT